MLKRILFLVCIPFISIFAAEPIVDVAPSWVTECKLPIPNAALKDQTHMQYLLFETQRNWEERTIYCHFAVKPLTEMGIEEASKINIDYDPSSVSVVVHSILLHRNGKTYERLKDCNSKLIQRESKLESNIYSGDLSLIYFIDDIREDDILEYSYSLVGRHPLFDAHFFEIFLLQFQVDVEKVAHRFLVDPSRNFYLKSFNTSLEPTYRDLTETLSEWSWEVNQTSPPICEAHEPDWYYPYAYVQATQYNNWSEVVEELAPLYTLAENFTPSYEMQELLDSWTKTTSDPKELALLATRFVQDEIRYLSLSDGIDGYQPKSPITTFERRYGDCKNKSFLLHAFLKCLGISSSPALVHATLGKALKNDLPAPHLFNHVILYIQIDNKEYWVDSTINLQGGALDTNYCPNYYWALLTEKGTQDLKAMQAYTLQAPNVVIDTTINLSSEDMAELTITTTHTANVADSIRRSVKWEGIKSTADQLIDDLQNKYPDATQKKPLSLNDDRTKNILTTIETYQIPTKKQAGKKTLNVFSYAVTEALAAPSEPNRTSPYEIPYPLWIQEHIHVNNPFAFWKRESEDNSFAHDSLVFDYEAVRNIHSADFDYELKYLKDHVSVDAFPEFYDIVNEIEQDGSLVIDIVTPRRGRG